MVSDIRMSLKTARVEDKTQINTQVQSVCSFSGQPGKCSVLGCKEAMIPRHGRFVLLNSVVFYCEMFLIVSLCPLTEMGWTKYQEHL